MEKSGFSKAKCSSSCSNRNNVWDCESTLYDSYELNSIKIQLGSAIANSPRTLSMPHLSERRHHHHHSLQQPQQPQPPSSSHCMSNKSFKISRSFQKLIGFVFKSSTNNKPRISSSASSSGSNTSHQVADKYSNKERFYVVYDKSEAVLSTIPELPEFEIGGLSPEISSLVRKSASERFTSISTGITCV